MSLTGHNEYMNEKTITEKIITDSPLELPQAVLYGVNTEGKTFVLASESDIYELLDNDYSDTEGLVGIVIQTTGWAAPLNADGEVEGRPSEHAERRRVALVSTLTMNGYCSGIKFADEEEVTYDEGTPSGALWEAMNECVERIRQKA